MIFFRNYLGPLSNQIYLVKFMCLTVDTSFIYKKNQMLQNITYIKKSFCNIWFFCKNEACVNCETTYN